MNSIRRAATSVGAGLSDSGFSAVASLAMGIFALRTLGTSQLALYSLFFSGWVVAQLLPAQLVFLPVRLAINLDVRSVRPNHALDLRRGIPALLVSPVLAAAAGIPLVHAVGLGEYLRGAFAIAVLTLIAPFNAHLRASLHIVQRHWRAAIVSAVTACIAIAAFAVVATSGFSGTDDAGLPFALLSGAMGCGVLTGILLLRSAAIGQYRVPALATRILYLVPDVSAQIGGYIVSVLVVALLGARELSELEGARVMSSPVLVVVTGLATFLVPATIRALAKGDGIGFRRSFGVMTITVLVVGAAYAAAVFAFGARIEALLGNRTTSALGAARSLASTVDASAVGTDSVLYAAGRASVWSVLTAVSVVVTLLLCVPLVGLCGVFGVPAAQGLGSCLRAVLGVRLARRVLP